MKQYLHQKEIARRFRVTTQLVSDLVTDFKKQPEKLRVAKEREKRVEQEKRAIIKAVTSI